ncbi:glycoside hydrolase family 18 protein [Rhexocercosporidium sp. MPI-PUGE-AT-0058]|nr:glycoside hydrolase family 18 protein [Rhexocercosporidium sp. MPI-PUGE-AT-0058]
MFWTNFIILFSLCCKLATCGSTSAAGNNITFRSVAYYANWAIYDRKFNPQDLPVNNLTHILYAFANIKPDTGEVYLSDAWADTDIPFPEDSPSEAGTNLYGCVKQLYLMKKKNRHLKILLSVGGSSYSANFAAPASTVSGRTAFASTAVTLVRNLGLDGLDIDWEFPADHAEAGNMVLLLQNVREALDAYGRSLSPPYHFQLTVACPAGPTNYQTMHIADMDKFVDFWNLMAWDYAGPWSTLASHQANLFRSTSEPAATPFDTQTAIKYYLSQNVSSDKLVLGVPIYGRSFGATDGLGSPFNGVGKGTWEAGVYDYKDLPLTGAVENYDNVSGASYSYDATTRELISYDTIMAGKRKATWIQQMKLGGIMWWEGSADGLGDKSLIRNTVRVLGDLRAVSNQLVYLDSVYDNLRAGMPGEGCIPVSSTKPAADITASPANSAGTLSSSTSKNDPALATAGENLGDSVPISYTTITLPATTHYITSVVIVTG